MVKRKQLRFGQGFHVIFANARAQAAQMVIPAGDSEGGPRNRHRGADQWLYVVAGTGVAKIGKKRLPLRAGTLLLLEHGDRHQIINNGRALLKTLNLYLPPAYTGSGNELPAARGS